MNSISWPANRGTAAARRMIWLPGAYHKAEDFISARFAEAAQQRGAALDLQFVDLAFDHLGDRSTVQRLRAEIVLPGRAAGVSTWLGGISLGGMIALEYALTYPGELDGLCLLAPYLGNRMLTGQIAAHGLSQWEPGELAPADEERRLWSYFKNRGPQSMPLYLGYGREDRFAPAHALLAATLPAQWVDCIAGDHGWETWRQLWENFLDSRHWTRAPGTPADA